jgi:hypothetical protein
MSSGDIKRPFGSPGISRRAFGYLTKRRIALMAVKIRFSFAVSRVAASAIV